MNNILPQINSKWFHHNGLKYTVILIANTAHTNVNYPITVVYKGNNGNVWTKSLENFLTTMSWYEGSNPIDNEIKETKNEYIT